MGLACEVSFPGNSVQQKPVARPNSDLREESNKRVFQEWIKEWQANKVPRDISTRGWQRRDLRHGSKGGAFVKGKDMRIGSEYREKTNAAGRCAQSE